MANQPNDGAAETIDVAVNGVNEAEAVSQSGSDEGLLHDPQAAEATNELASTQAALSAAEAKATEHWDRLLRLQAEMENLRRRNQKDLENARKFALEGFAGELLGVRDSLEMGLSASEQSDVELGKIYEGLELTLKMLIQAMDKFNIQQLDPAGEKFNPELHQAMSMQPAEGVAPNMVVTVIQKGYVLNDRLLRPALVTVSK